MKSSRQLNCIAKLITVCGNRGMGELADDILHLVAPKYIDKKDIKTLFGKTPSTIKYADKTSFLSESAFKSKCVQCTQHIEVKEPIFLHGKQSYHVLCGLEACPDADSNAYYKRWCITVKNEKENQQNPFEEV